MTVAYPCSLCSSRTTPPSISGEMMSMRIMVLPATSVVTSAVMISCSSVEPSPLGILMVSALFFNRGVVIVITLMVNRQNNNLAQKNNYYI